MKLRELLDVLSHNEKITVTDQAYNKKTGKYYSFRTVYYQEAVESVLNDSDEYVLDLGVTFVSGYGPGELAVTVASFIDIKED